MGGKLGVDIFILISGYFLINSNERKTSKILKLWIQVFTYSIIAFIIVLAIGIKPTDFKEVISNILPITSKQMWFASTYFVLYLIFPYINIFLKNLDKNTYKRMLVLLTVCWCIIPTFFKENFESNSLIWFIYMYMLAAYIRLYVPKNKIQGKKCIMIAIIVVIITFLAVIVIDVLGTSDDYFLSYTTYFYSMQRLPFLLISVFTFLGFLKLDIGYNKFVNNIAETTFGIYLIHDNNYIRPLLWKVTLNNAMYAASPILIPYSIIIIVGVFIACSVIELIRIHVLEKNYMKLLNKFSNFIDRCIERLFLLKSFEK